MRVPLIDTAPPPEFGDVVTDEKFRDPTFAGADHSYVPGFSDMRRERDLAMAELRAGKRKAKDVPTLPVNCRWVRNQRINGDPDNSKLWRAQQRGYEPVTKDQIGKVPWLKSLPVGAVTDAQGFIRNGDTVLCVATKERAAQNEAYKAWKTRQRSDAAVDTFAKELEKQRINVKGADPYVEQSVEKTEK